MFPWCDTQKACFPYAVGDRVRSGANSRGTVVSVDGSRIEVQWDDGDYGPITYPMETDCLRKELPWE